MLGFKNNQLSVLKSAAIIEVIVSRAGDLTTPASATVLVSGADIYYPAAQQYNDLKFLVQWAAGEGGEKKVSFSIEKSTLPIEYILLTIDDILGDTVGSSRMYVALADSNIQPKWIPETSGTYIPTVTVDSTGVRSYSYTQPGVGNSPLIEPNFTPNTATAPGKAGNVPAPPASNKPQLLDSSGWTDSPIPAIISDIATLTIKKANIESPDLTGKPTTPTPIGNTTPNQITNVSYVTNAIGAALEGVDIGELEARVKEVEVKKAPLASPILTGTPKSITPAISAAGDEIATAAFVKGAVTTALEGVDIGDLEARLKEVELKKAPLASPSLTGKPTSITPATTAKDTEIATAGFVVNLVTTALEGVDIGDLEARLKEVELKKATIFSPALTGKPTSTTPATTAVADEIATAGFVKSAVTTALEGVDIGDLEARLKEVELKKATILSPALTGTPTTSVPTNTSPANQIATVGYVQSLASPDPDFKPNTTTTDGTAGNVPAPLKSPDPQILTNNGWSSAPKIKTPLATVADDSIATTKFVKDALTASLESAIKPGMTMMWASDGAPVGWLLCDGSAISRSQYPQLFATIQTKHGVGDGSTTFNLPNSINLFPRGAAGGSPGARGGSATALLDVTNIPSHTHGVTVDPHAHNSRQDAHGHTTAPNSHGHNVSQSPHAHTGNAGAHDHLLPIYGRGSSGGTPSGDYSNSSTDPNTKLRTDAASSTLAIDPANANISVDAVTINLSIDPAQPNVYVDPASVTAQAANTGGGQAFAIVPEYFGINFIIKY